MSDSWFLSISESLLQKLDNLTLSELKHLEKDFDALQGLFKENANFVDSWKILSGTGQGRLVNPLQDVKYIDNYIKTSGASHSNIKAAIEAAGGFDKWKRVTKKGDDFANGVDEFLEGFVGTVRRANAEEIAQASTRIKNHRIEVGNPDRANYGYLEGIVNGQSIDNKIIRSSKPKAGEPEIFRAIEVEGSNGKSWLRNTDSEYKMLNKLADDLGGVSGNKYPNITGEIKIISENPYCKSCQGILHQFSEMYPNIKLILVDGI